MRKCKMGCTCKLCLLEAYEQWMEDSDDPEVYEFIAEVINEDYQPQDVVEWDYKKDYPQ